MNIKLTDDELVALGSFSGGWPWPLPSIPDDQRNQAITRGLASLLARDLLTEETLDSALNEVSAFITSNKTIISFVIAPDGTPLVPDMQYLAIWGEEDRWLLDVRVALGVHNLYFTNTSDLITLLSTVAKENLNNDVSQTGGTFVLMAHNGDVFDGVAFADVCRTVHFSDTMVTFGDPKSVNGQESNASTFVEHLVNL